VYREVIEDVIQKGNPSQGTGFLSFGRMPNPEKPLGFMVGRHPQRRSVDGQETKTLPPTMRECSIEEGNELGSQLHERLEGQFPSGPTPCPGGYLPYGHGSGVEYLEKTIQLLLESTANPVHEEKNDDGKGELAVTREVLFRQPISA